jgi:IS30 family transposase
MKKYKLTQQERNEVLGLLSLGCSRTTAAKSIHRSPVTLREDILAHPKFAEEVAKAESGTEVFYLSKIRKAATKEQYWRAAAWVLERRLPERYGIKKAKALTSEQVQKFMTACLQIITEEITDEEQKEKIFQRLDEELGATESS